MTTAQVKTIPAGTPDQWRERVVFTFHCRGCDKPLLSPEYESEAWFSGESPITAYEVMDENGWAEVEHAWYCSACFHTCWEADEMPRLGSEKACKVCRAAQDGGQADG